LLFDAFIFELEKDRAGQETDREVLNAFTTILKDLDQYDKPKKPNLTLFIDLVKRSSSNYYRQIFQTNAPNPDCAEYLGLVYKVITHEVKLIERVVG
jgi:hypothetical protein